MNRRQRRLATKQWQAQFEEWRAHSAKYAGGDPYNTVETFEMFENLDDDKPADVLIACDLLEHLPDPDAALWKMKSLAAKCVIFTIETDEIRSIESWKRIIGQVFPIPGNGVTRLTDRRYAIVASCTNPFGADKIVAAGTKDGRWDNILSNIKAVRARVQFSGPHDRRAVVACYGPSIKHNLDLLKQDMAAGGADLISVSGSHDFLLNNDIRPDIHVECDPRPHKADNIAKGNHYVRYFLGSVVSPVLTDKLKECVVALWHPSGEFNFRIVDELEPGATFVGAFLNVGLTSLSLLYRMGYRNFSIYGMDCSFEGEEIWAGPHAQKQNQKQQTILTVMCGGRPFTTSGIYIAYANAFFDLIKTMPDAHFNIYGDSLLQQMSREYMKLSEAA